MMCLRSMGMSDRRASQPVSRAELRYCAAVKPCGPYVKPSCSIPTDSTLVRQFPACQAISERCTSCTILPLREMTKWDDAWARGLLSHCTEPQKLPSVTCTTMLLTECGARCAFV